MIDYEKLIENEDRYYAGKYLWEIVEKAVSAAETFDDVLERGGLRELFEKALPAEAAADLCKLVGRLEYYTYNKEPYRRFLRSSALQSHIVSIYWIAQGIYADWESDWAVHVKADDAAWRPSDGYWINPWLISMLIALKIDREDQETIGTITDMLLPDNNASGVITAKIIRGVAMSHNAQLHEIIKKLLLAAKPQEGQLQAILETADDGTLGYFKMMMRTILENDIFVFLPQNAPPAPGWGLDTDMTTSAL